MANETPARKKRARKAVGPKLRYLLYVVFALFALLVVNSVYLVSVTIAGEQYQNLFYLNMFLLHLILGLAIIVPVIVFGAVHIRNTYNRPNRTAVKVGYGLFTAAIGILISGIVLMRVDVGGFRFEVNDATMRGIGYWSHVLLPLFAIWLYILHRLAGKRIQWKRGAWLAAAALVFASVALVFQIQAPKAWNQEGPERSAPLFTPSLARTSNGDFMPMEVLYNDQYCAECHQTSHETWMASAHKFSSFNNPVYLMSIRETRQVLMEKDGHVKDSRFCAGCHDPIPFFSGLFEDERFTDPNHDLSTDITANAGITCTVCHSISHINSPRGNAAYTIDAPTHYPFAFSDNPALAWINRQLIKAKPEFHKATFLKPLHKEPEFCGSCHKVHLPQELNDYKWLRGQNHFDTFWLSGVSGQGIESFYYPPKAQENCNGCHMPNVEAPGPDNFGASVRDDSGLAKTFSHMFPSANTAMPHLLRDQFKDPDQVIQAHREFNEGVMRLDIFALKEDGKIDGELVGPLRPQIPKLEPGKTYLMELVVRTVKMGHLFTQGTSDSNQIWLDVTLKSGDRIIGRSGDMDERGKVDPWSHFINSFVLDRQGNRINRRNAQDIFVPLYNNQIPPGAADVVHYRFNVPDDLVEPVEVEAVLRYRKFDTEIMEITTGNPNYVNDLPIMDLAQDSLILPVGEGDESSESVIPEWQRWNDYGIGLFRKGRLGELRQAKHAFSQVEALGKPDGPLNLARVYLKEGLVQSDAPRALARANEMGANQWSLLWFGAQVAERNGDYDKAIANMREIIKGGFAQAAGRGFDFSKDYRVLNALGNALYQKGLAARANDRQTFMQEAKEFFDQTLVYDPENLTAHWGLFQIHRYLGDQETADYHKAQHATYKPDDNARDFAVAQARLKYPAANKASESVVIYDLKPQDN